MSTLFTVNRAWHDSTWIFEQLCFARQGDAILLIEDAVLATHSAITLGSFSAKCEGLGVQVFVLRNDCKLRGIDNKYSGIKEVDYSEFVELVAQHDKQVAW